MFYVFLNHYHINGLAWTLSGRLADIPNILICLILFFSILKHWIMGGTFIFVGALIEFSHSDVAILLSVPKHGSC